MEKIYLLLFFCLSSAAFSQIVPIPDSVFKSYLLIYGVDTNADGQIQVSEAQQVTTMNYLTFVGSSLGTIHSLQGIEYFTNLTSLAVVGQSIPTLDLSSLHNLETVDCHFNGINSLNITGLSNLVTLECSNNYITSLNLTGLSSLVSLYCSSNALTTLNAGGLTNLQVINACCNDISSINVAGLNSLYRLWIPSNELTTLDVTNLISLTDLDCGNNNLTTLDLQTLVNLYTLTCSDNDLVSVNVNGLTSLYNISCSNNQLTSLNLSGLTALEYVHCPNNSLTSLNVTGAINMKEINCVNNQITSLDVSNFAQLNTLRCHFNQLTSLNLNGASAIITLQCEGNLLTSLNLSSQTSITSASFYNNPNLTELFAKNGRNEGIGISGVPNLQYVCVDEMQLASVRGAVYTAGLYPTCNVNTYCSFVPGGTYYTVQGSSIFDSNSNGCDGSDIDFPEMKIVVSSSSVNQSLIADTSGDYQLHFQAGTYTMTPQFENPSYFTISPSTVSVTLPPAVNPVIQNFCISNNGIHNDLEITILPITPARPGFDSKYEVVYRNKGNTTLSGIVNLNFADSVIDYVLSNPSINSQTINNLNWNYTNLLPFETRKIQLTLNLNTPTETPPLNGGAVLNLTVSITPTVGDDLPADNTFLLEQTVVNSFDPNDKKCLAGVTIPLNDVGKYVYYVIRFENTGTYPAENIVVDDFINQAKFDVSTLRPVSSSHPFRIKITPGGGGNYAEFIFENINLPFDDANNDGYVAFKIKTRSNLVVSDTFSNSANIYFDYNYPILTNNYTTTVTALSNQDFEFSNYISLFPNPVKNSVSIGKKQDIEISSVNFYNMFGQLIMVVTGPSEMIDVSNLKTGTYFINIISDKGTSSIKFLKE